MLKVPEFNKNLVYPFLGIIILIHVLVLTKLIYFPYPELFIYPYLTNQGLKPYSQILDQHFPGLLFLPVNLNNLGMTTPETAKLWSIAIVILVQIMLFAVGSGILKSRTKALFVNLLYLAWQPFFEGWVLWIDSFLPLVLLPAFYSLLRGAGVFDSLGTESSGRTSEVYNLVAQTRGGVRGIRGRRWLFVGGLLLGLGIVIKQTMIPLAALILIYLFWKLREVRIVSIYISGLSIPALLMAVYFIGIGVWRDFWYWTVVFNLTTYAEYGTKAPPSVGYVNRLLFVYGMSVLAWLNTKKGIVLLLFIFIIGSLPGALERADFVRLAPSLPFVALATVYGFGGLGKLGRFGFISIYCLVLVWWLVIFYKGHLGNRVISFDVQTRDLADKIKYYTQLGEKIFVFGGEPHLYQMSETMPAGDVFVFQFPWFFKAAEGRLLEGIKRDKPVIIVSDRTVMIEGKKITDFGKNIDRYILENYERIDSVGTTDILRRL